ncbi:hypothetical protein [Hungatella hathewayi]|uniref:hypothetical protein n=1 Tax=Hungatella hathewayi TaxID=154046 RepID=UPI00356A2B0F
MSSQRKKALRDYVPKQVPAKNNKGYKTEFIYQGGWYVWDCSPETLRSFRLQALAATVLTVVLFLSGALQRTVCNTVSFVAVPSLLSILALMLGTYGLFSRFLRVSRLQEYDFRSMHFKVQAGFAAYAFFILLAAAGCFFTIASGRWTSISRELFTAFCYLICGILSLAVCLCFKRLSYHREEGGRVCNCR